MIRRYRRRLQSQRLKNQHKKIRQPAPQISPVHSPLCTPEQSDSEHQHHTSDSDTSLDIYYHANSNHRPEMGESNAESVLRHENIEKDVKRMKQEREQRRQKKKHGTIDITNNVQEIQLDTDYNLYENPNKTISLQPIPFLFDTSAALTMISSQPPWAWTNLRDCLYAIGGCFNGPTQNNLKMGEYHKGETIRVIIPEAVQLTPHIAHSNLIANTAYLMAGHKYLSDLHKPKLKFKGGGKYTMEVNKGHLIVKILPTDATQIYLHEDKIYEPPTFSPTEQFQYVNRANLQTPTAFLWHLRYACKCISLLKHTQEHVIGMNVQGSWKALETQLPCTACIAGKMRKIKKTPTKCFTDINSFAVTWKPGNDHKIVNSNESVALDWGIVNKKNQPKTNNVFAIYLDTNTGFVFGFPAENRAQAGLSLLTYIQRHGQPKQLVHDNAKEFIEGEFKQICMDKNIEQIRTTPFDHNKNPTELYMEILTAMTRSLLFISGLPANKFWEHALEHATTLQNRTALMGRCTPYETRYGKRPHVNHLRVFGCEAMAYIEKDKRHKLDYKVERCIYLGMSTTHTDDTAKLLLLKTMTIIYRRNVHYNERSYPARKLKHNTSTTKLDTGEDLIGLQFEDEDQWWTITEHGTHDGDLVLWYTNNDTKEEEKSSVQEVREWYNSTQLQQASTHLTNATNAIQPIRKGYINKLAEEVYTHVKHYDVKLPDNQTQKPTSFKKAGNSKIHSGFKPKLKKKMGCSTLIPGHDWISTASHPKSAVRHYDAIIYTILKGITQLKTEWLLMEVDNTQILTAIQLLPLRDNFCFEYSYPL